MENLNPVSTGSTECETRLGSIAGSQDKFDYIFSDS